MYFNLHFLILIIIFRHFHSHFSDFLKYLNFEILTHSKLQIFKLLLYISMGWLLFLLTNIELIFLVVFLI